jgi:hypothetical protein
VSRMAFLLSYCLVAGALIGCDRGTDRTTPESAGIKGVCWLTVHGGAKDSGSQTTPYTDLTITIQSADGKQTIAQVKSDREGKFEVRLKPGTYRLVTAESVGPAVVADRPAQEVVVKPGTYTAVEVRYQGFAP